MTLRLNRRVSFWTISWERSDLMSFAACLSLIRFKIGTGAAGRDDLGHATPRTEDDRGTREECVEYQVMDLPGKVGSIDQHYHDTMVDLWQCGQLRGSRNIILGVFRIALYCSPSSSLSPLTAKTMPAAADAIHCRSCSRLCRS
jgi:hypothetical protein